MKETQAMKETRTIKETQTMTPATKEVMDLATKEITKEPPITRLR
jgi:hypothetical protein